jgi:hypothetical protein
VELYLHSNTPSWLCVQLKQKSNFAVNSVSSVQERKLYILTEFILIPAVRLKQRSKISQETV